MDSIACATMTIVGAALLLAGSSFAVDAVRTRTIDANAADATRAPRTHIAFNRRAGQHVFRASNLAPGTVGRRFLVIGNDGERRVRRIALTQDDVVDTGFGHALRLQLYDRTTNRCLHPAPSGRARRLPGPCRGWGEWDGSATLRDVALTPRFGDAWRHGERHVIDVRFTLLQTSTNADQGQSASFRLRWRHVA